MADNTKDMRGRIPKLPEVKAYEPVPYDVEVLLDPFKASKIEPESKNRQGSGKGGAFQPDFEARDLRNSLLEKYPVESLKMIGYLNINRRPIAVIQVENKVKQVKVGDYVGLDFGLVTQVTEKEVLLRELIQDSAGDWSERTSSLYLQGKEGSNK
ncbi:MAG: pilus assembly protein PilP [Dechloromonas sp.]|uniref:Pilus assembly protein PilP n=1 Tax=Candidatus Dechloromonas phosphorivorans TaxID=2899244 RepID=A0A9D7QK59_9RHOO|nr:pilus assembly protein PilP [Candidatus Dechloromonas phosphorivorans]